MNEQEKQTQAAPGTMPELKEQTQLAPQGKQEQKLSLSSEDRWNNFFVFLKMIEQAAKKVEEVARRLSSMIMALGEMTIVVVFIVEHVHRTIV